ncbi:hypothetical protein ACFL4P_00690 [Gemmatimonadota bacterium]
MGNNRAVLPLVDYSLLMFFIFSLLVVPQWIHADDLSSTVQYKEDINGDGNVNIVDAIALILKGSANPSDPEVDYNGDGGFSVMDAIALLINIVQGNLTRNQPLPGDAEHKELTDGAVAVTGPGSYGEPGTTYMLTGDITSETSAIFLGNDVTLDLNGYSITYADASYEQVPNHGFEQGLEGWDISNAPNARVEDTETVHTFVGDKILRLPYGEEIASPYINLPVANRSYYAMCGVAKSDMKVTINVDDESGNPISCSFTFSGNERVSCPETDRSPKLGGGFVFAHLHDLPAGKYRIRVKAETHCLIDEVDIRPALDVGVGVVDRTYPWAYYKCILDGDYTAFFDYTEEGTTSTPIETIPQVSGAGMIIIKNGIIRSSAVGIRSWGLQSTAGEANIILENVRFIASGINTNAVDVPHASISNCRFEIDTPFIIDRHRTDDQPVALRGDESSEVSNCQFIGGQGCLKTSGNNTIIHDNLFVNRQTVTNHYCINVSGDRTHIYDNRFEPEIGSGIFIGRTKQVEVYRNTFTISSSPPTCEYGHEEYSVNAVRISDYNADPESQDGSDENRVYENSFRITGMDYPIRSSYVPMAYGVFLSVGGGTNFIHDNEIVIEHLDPESKAEAAAFYIGSSNNGGEWYNNTVTSNVPAIWVASRYGSAADAKFSNNTFIRAENAPEDYKPVRMGWYSATASDIQFRSNTFTDCQLSVEETDQNHSYSVYWTLTASVQDMAGNPLVDTAAVITDNIGTGVFSGRTDSIGEISTELLQYRSSGGNKDYSTPYTVSVAGIEQTVDLNENTLLTLKQK